MFVKSEEMELEERRLEDFILQFETVLFCGATRILETEEDLETPRFKILVGASPSLAALVEVELATKVANTEWARCSELNLMIVRGRIAQQLTTQS